MNNDNKRKYEWGEGTRLETFHSIRSGLKHVNNDVISKAILFLKKKKQNDNQILTVSEQRNIN